MMRQAITRNSLILGLFAITTAGLLALTNNATVPKIECNRQAALKNSLLEVMPAAQFDNTLLTDFITVSDPQLGRNRHHIYRARLDGSASGAVLEATAPDGYGGKISLLVGVTADGTVTGVRVVPPHNETPGLGDKVELKKSDWVLDFDGTSLGDPEPERWAVKKDGGDFDSFTGATITPRAVVGQVKRALEYYEQHREEIYATPAEPVEAQSCEEADA
ncbi:MAG: electron transport complex subunit RsxG [Alcanivoracaceae bacterium]|nr:electron transport complex subunit RsxG [Alcanivoracaceae bacterium]